MWFAWWRGGRGEGRRGEEDSRVLDDGKKDVWKEIEKEKRRRGFKSCERERREKGRRRKRGRRRREGRNERELELFEDRVSQFTAAFTRLILGSTFLSFLFFLSRRLREA